MKLLTIMIIMVNIAYAGNIKVVRPKVRLLPPTSVNTAGFMLLKNNSDNDIKLVSAKSTLSKKVELHNHINEDGMMKMRQVSSILIPAKGEVELKPGSFHIMFLGLKSTLIENELVEIELGFDKSESITVKAPILKLHMHQH